MIIPRIRELMFDADLRAKEPELTKMVSGLSVGVIEEAYKVGLAIAANQLLLSVALTGAIMDAEKSRD